MPSVEEVGLLMKDKVASWRLSNQIKILNKAQEKCAKNNISPKAISLKLLCPYLENASLEEDEYMQDKWANLLTNLVDSQQNIENNIFPYILSQISKDEYEFIEYIFRNTSNKNYLYNKNESIEKNLPNHNKANLIRLGILEKNFNQISSKEESIIGMKSQGSEKYELSIEYNFTELGVLFLEFCSVIKSYS